MFQIRDTVHGDISLMDIYADIVDTPEFQRLRSIEQGSFRPVFPGARHDRFIHSLGTYHLATKFAQHFFKNIRKDVSDYCLTRDEEKALSTTFRYAALLHDIGHAPYSHTTEDFFRLKKNTAGNSVILDGLRNAIASLGDADALAAFDLDFPACDPSAHEIISATLLITNSPTFLIPHPSTRNPAPPLSDLVDLSLAARMVIGCTYDYTRYENLSVHDKILLGVRNCMIRLLNSSAVDVDRLDYLIRDTKMSGFINTPVNVEHLADAVTAVRLNNTDWLYPAFRNDAMGVLESMFHAKREHDFWVLNHPSGAYDAALRAHCISRMEDYPGNPGYMTTVFTAEALGREGVRVADRTYRLLNDDDIGADLKRHYNDYPLIQEIYSRENRRTTVWKDYYEYRWLFNNEAKGLDEDQVYAFFLPLMDYLARSKRFQLDAYTYSIIMHEPDAAAARPAATFLHDFFTDLDEKARKTDPTAPSLFDLVLLPRVANLSYKFDPTQTYILFPRMPRNNDLNYASFAFLKNTDSKQDKHRMFYLYAPKSSMNIPRKSSFRTALINTLCPARTKKVPRV